MGTTDSVVDHELLEEAEAALAIAPGSVTDKPVPAGIGCTPNDFVSIGRYSWPDPDTADGLPWIRRDCVVNETASSAEFDLARYKLMAESSTTLALAYQATGRAEFAERAAAHLERWFLDPDTRMRPHLKHAAVLPGVNTGSWYGIIQGAVLTRVPFVAAAIADSEAWTPRHDTELRAWFGAYVDWLHHGPQGRRQATEGKNNNTMLWYHTQRVVLGVYAGVDEIAREAMQQIPICFASQIAPDGSLPEEIRRADSLVYSVYWLTAAVTAAAVSPLHGVDLWSVETDDGRSLRSCLDFLAPYLLGEVDWPWPNPDAQPLQEHVWVYGLATEAYGDPRYAAVARHVPAGVAIPAHIRFRQRLMTPRAGAHAS